MFSLFRLIPFSCRRAALFVIRSYKMSTVFTTSEWSMFLMSWLWWWCIQMKLNPELEQEQQQQQTSNLINCAVSVHRYAVCFWHVKLPIQYVFKWSFFCSIDNEPHRLPFTHWFFENNNRMQKQSKKKTRKHCQLQIDNDCQMAENEIQLFYRFFLFHFFFGFVSGCAYVYVTYPFPLRFRRYNVTININKTIKIFFV